MTQSRAQADQVEVRKAVDEGVYFSRTKVCLQGRGKTHFTQLILSLSMRFTLFVLAFKVELVKFTCDGRQRLPLGLRQKQADIQSRQQADRAERHKAELTQLTL